MKRYQDSSNYISHCKRLASIMNSTAKDGFLRNSRSLNSLGRRPDLTDRKSPNSKALPEKFVDRQAKWLEYKENLRIAQSIVNKPSVVNFHNTEENFQKHLRIRKLRRKFPQKRCRSKEVKLVDLVWKNHNRNHSQVYQLASKQGWSLKGRLMDITQGVILGPVGQDLKLSILSSSKKGRITVKDSSIVPIVHKGKAIGTAIVDIAYR